MNIGPMYQKNRAYFISADEMRSRIEQSEKLSQIDVPKDSTSISYRSSSGAQIGFIASESKPFCSNCSRLRLTAKGQLRACLMSVDGKSLLGQKLEAYPGLLKSVMELKPFTRLENINQPMYQIGG